MRSKWHLLIGFVASYILIQFFDFSLLSGLIIFLSSWLIDIDHYFWYGFEFKDWSPINALRWRVESVSKWGKLSKRERSKFKRGIFIFHSIGFWIILFVLSFVYDLFLWILIGVGIHMIADWADLIQRGNPISNKVFLSSIVRRNKNKKSLKEL